MPEGVVERQTLGMLLVAGTMWQVNQGWDAQGARGHCWVAGSCLGWCCMWVSKRGKSVQPIEHAMRLPS